MAATRSSVGGQVRGSGQSARCTERPPVSPRQISSVTSGSSGAATRVRVSSAVYSVSKASRVSVPEPVARRRMYQLVSMSR